METEFGVAVEFEDEDGDDGDEQVDEVMVWSSSSMGGDGFCLM